MRAQLSTDNNKRNKQRKMIYPRRKNDGNLSGRNFYLVYEKTDVKKRMRDKERGKVKLKKKK